jgi:hypothetical protein
LNGPFGTSLSSGTGADGVLGGGLEWKGQWTTAWRRLTSHSHLLSHRAGGFFWVKRWVD